MWFESQNCAMMGLQATTGKRKLEAATAPNDSSPPKSGRWEPDDCIARLQAVAVPGDSSWRSSTPSLAATLLTTATACTSSSDDYEEEEDDFDDDLSDGGGGAGALLPPEPAARFPHSFRYPPDYWQYYQPPQQQTIRCEENGKSYLELGASPPPQRTRCCDGGRTRWCHSPCYRQRRLAVLNLSMCKLARYRQCSDPSLRRSVLICNTLRRLEREMEAEPPEPPAAPAPQVHQEMLPRPMQPPEQQPPTTATGPGAYEQSLREMTCSSGRLTPFPQASSAGDDLDSGLGGDDDAASRPINWGSVLSLSSQTTDLEALNNNDLYAELGLGGHDWTNKEQSTGRENEWDGFMQHVLVGGT